MIECFNERFVIASNSNNIVDIGDIAEELWIYSKTVELLQEPNDKDYLASELEGKKESIIEKLKSIFNMLPEKDRNWIKDLCMETISGRKFDDDQFNDLISRYT